MSNVYSKKLATIDAPLTGFFSNEIGGPPAGYVWVVREIDLSANAINPGDIFFVSVTPLLFTTKLTLIELGQVIDTGWQAQWQGHLVMDPGDVLSITGDGFGATTVLGWVSGYQLTLP